MDTKVKHKVFDKGIVEKIHENERAYLILLMDGIKPITYDYQVSPEIF